MPITYARMVLHPAYGRNYKTADDAKRDFENGKDFRLWGGPYCSKRDFLGQTVSLAYVVDGIRCYVEVNVK